MMQLGDRVCSAAAVLAVSLLTQLPVQAAPSADVKELRTKYEQMLASFQSDSEKELQGWPQAYAAELNKVEEKFQSGGDLEGLLAVRGEIARFKKESKIPDDAVVAVSPVLRDVQLKWQKMPETIEIEKSKKIVSFSRKYFDFLEELKKKLTMKGQVEEAIEANNEIARVRALAAYTAAEFVLANAGASRGSEAGKDPKQVPERQPEGVEAEKPSVAGADVRASLVLYYSFDRNENGKVTDQSGKRNNATVRGARYSSSGKRGGAYQFDGVNDVIEGEGENTLPTGGSAKTVLFWVRPEAVGGIMLKHGNDAHITSQGLSFNICGNWTIWLAGYNVDLISKGAMIPNSWNHVGVTYESANACLYINGVMEASGRFAQNIPDGTNLEIGHNTLCGKDSYFKGMIDEVMIFDRALSKDEVMRIYNSQR